MILARCVRNGVWVIMLVAEVLDDANHDRVIVGERLAILCLQEVPHFMPGGFTRVGPVHANDSDPDVLFIREAQVLFEARPPAITPKRLSGEACGRTV